MPFSFLWYHLNLMAFRSYSNRFEWNIIQRGQTVFISLWNLFLFSYRIQKISFKNPPTLEKKLEQKICKIWFDHEWILGSQDGSKTNQCNRKNLLLSIGGISSLFWHCLEMCFIIFRTNISSLKPMPLLDKTQGFGTIIHKSDFVCFELI